MKVLLIDHEDSFVYNIQQALGILGARVDCLRYTVPEARAVRSDPDAIVLSPGPGNPSDRRVTGLSRALVERWGADRPFLGVCLGHQLLGSLYGARVVRAPAPVHGEIDQVHHRGTGLFEGITSPFDAARYHSLCLDPPSVRPPLEVTATGGRGLVMAVRHRTRPTVGVQFHPESYLTAAGPRILANFLREAHR